MSTLATQQGALLAALFIAQHAPQAESAEGALAGHVHTPWQRGLAAYRANAHASAERSLLAAFPVVAALMGEDSFALMARDFWHQHPPVRGDLAQWGDALPGFIAGNAQLDDVPYLADVAQVEWALHRIAGAPDATADPATFALLSTTDPDALTLRLPPGCEAIASDWPVASLINAHRLDDPSMEQAAEKVRAHEAEHALVWRHDLRPRLRVCSAAEAVLVNALAGRQPLLAALDAALALDPVFDLGAWLPAAVHSGLVLAADPLPVHSDRKKVS